MKFLAVRTLKLSSALFAGLIALTFLTFSSADDNGALLAQRVYDRADGKDSTALTMTLTKPGSPRVR